MKMQNGFVDKRDCEHSILYRGCAGHEKKACEAAVNKSSYIFEDNMGDETPYNEWKMPTGDDHVSFIQSYSKQYIIGMANEQGGCIYFGLSERKDDRKKRIDQKHVQGVNVSMDGQSNIETSIINYFRNEVKGLGNKKCPDSYRCPFHLVWFPVVDGTSNRQITDRWILEIHVFSIKFSLETIFFLETSNKGIHLVTYSYPRQQLDKITEKIRCLDYLKCGIDAIKQKSRNVKPLEDHWDRLNRGQATSHNTSSTTESLDMLLKEIPSSVKQTLKGIFSEDHSHSQPLVLIAGCLISKQMPSGDNLAEAIRKMLCKIPWSLVIDTDPSSKLNGLLSTAINSGTPYKFEWFRYGTELPTSIYVADQTYWVSVFGVENDQKNTFPVIKDLESFPNNQRKLFKNFINIFRSAFKAFEKPKVCVIRLSCDSDGNQLFNKLTDSVIEDLDSNDIVILSANEPASDSLKKMYVESFISLPLPSSDPSAASHLELLLKYYIGDAVRGEHNGVFVSGVGNTKICVPPTYVTALKARKVAIIQHYSLNKERYDLRSDEQLRHQTEFYMGKAVTFESLHYAHEIHRDSIKCHFPSNDVTSTTVEICKMVADQTKAITGTYWIQICHDSGAGGTTLARKLIYHLAEQYPCIMLDDWTGDGDDKMLSLAVAEVTEFRRFLKGVDVEVLCFLVEDSTKTANFILDQLTQIRNTASFVLITTDRIKADSDWPKKKEYYDRNTTNSRTHLRLFLRTGLSSYEMSAVTAKLVPFANDKTMKDKLRKLTEDKNNSLPFWLFGIYCFAADYIRIKQVVSNCLESARNSPFEADVLKFTSLVKVYASLPTPWSLFKLFKRTRMQNTDFIYSQTVSFQTRQLLLDYPTNEISVAHPMLAEEILEQLCGMNDNPNDKPNWLWRLVDEFFRVAFDRQTKKLFESDIELHKIIKISVALLGVDTRRAEKSQFGKLLSDIDTNSGDKSKQRKNDQQARPDNASQRNIDLLSNIGRYLNKFEPAVLPESVVNNRQFYGDSDRDCVMAMLLFKRSLVIHEAYYVEQRTRDFKKAKGLLEDFLASLPDNDSINSVKSILHNSLGSILRREALFIKLAFNKSNQDSKRKPQKEELERFIKTITDLWLKSVDHHREAFKIDSCDLYGLTGEALMHLSYMEILKDHKFCQDHQGFRQWLQNVPDFPKVNSFETQNILTQTLNLWTKCTQYSWQSKSDDLQKLESMINKYVPKTYTLVGDIDKAISILNERLDIPESLFAYVRCHLGPEKFKITISDETMCRELVRLLWPFAVNNHDNKFKGESIRTILRIMPHISISRDEMDKVMLAIASDGEKMRGLLWEWLGVAPEFELGDANFFLYVHELVTPIDMAHVDSTATKKLLEESAKLAEKNIDKDKSILYLGQKSGNQRFIFHKDIDIPDFHSGHDFVHFFDHEAEDHLQRLKGTVDRIKDYKTGYLNWRGAEIFFRPYSSIRTLMANGTEVWFFLSFSKSIPKADGVVPVIICDNSGKLDPDRMMEHLKEKGLRPWHDRPLPYYSPVLDGCHLGKCGGEICSSDGDSDSPMMHTTLSSPDQPKYLNWKGDNKPLDQLDTLMEHLMRCTASTTELASFLATTKSQSLLNNKMGEKNGVALHFLIDENIPNIDETKLLPVVELLLKNGASMNMKDSSGKTPYELLCQKCPDNNYAKTKEKLNPLNTTSKRRRK